MQKINIAIDGPAGAGKSTVAKLIADKLHFVYIDTGAMYRALTWKAMEENVDLHSDDQLGHLLQEVSISLVPESQGQKVLINDVDVSEAIRSREVTNQVSVVAGHPLVREGMLRLQQKLAQNKGVVMDGRDIGTHVLPDAEIKIYLSASIEERAKRRYLELEQKGEAHDFEELKKEIMLRDEKDMQREIAPLSKAADAIEVDTTGLSIEQVVDKIIGMIQERFSGLKVVE